MICTCASSFFGRAHRVARAFPELRTTLGGASVVPDISVYRWDRVPSDERGNVPEDVQEPPDIAVEVISPGQTLKELVDRCRWYVEHGVRVVLLVTRGAAPSASSARGPSRVRSAARSGSTSATPCPASS
ncbi:MAG: Uma2 family endonuclease [Chloroflexi bacterium]|nr:Uma2 family endonuclease [Chloroflexota bacterium]